MLAQAVFDFLGRDVFAAANDQVLDATGDLKEALAVDAGFIARVEPVVRVNRGGSRLLVVVVPLHHVVAAHAEFAALARRTRRTAHRIDNLHFHFGKGHADGLRALLYARIPWCHRDAGRRFGHSVGNRDLGEVHLAHHPPHQRLRTQRSGHDARYEAR